MSQPEIGLNFGGRVFEGWLHLAWRPARLKNSHVLPLGYDGIGGWNTFQTTGP